LRPTKSKRKPTIFFDHLFRFCENFVARHYDPNFVFVTFLPAAEINRENEIFRLEGESSLKFNP